MSGEIWTCKLVESNCLTESKISLKFIRENLTKDNSDVARDEKLMDAMIDYLKNESDSVRNVKSGKRTLPEGPEKQDDKKIKLTNPTPDDEVANEDPAVTKEKKQLADKKPTVLGSVAAYLKKNDLKNLTKEDLEEICKLKVCEAIYYKSEMGELRHQLSLQEQIVEKWRKDVAQLSKQARDLAIVNKRLLHEVRLRNERETPLVPVKITRSVGLQVCSDMLPNVAATKQRRLKRTPQTSSPAFNLKPQIRSPLLNNSNNKINKLPTPSPTGPTVATPAVSSQTTATPAAASAPVSIPTVTTPKIENKIPVNRIVKNPTITTKTVIDLTDEDTASTPARSSPVVAKSAMVSKAVTATTEVRILTSTIKPGVLASGQVVPTTNTYNNNQLLTADGKPTNQKVMFKIGSSNGVLASVANGSAIAVNTTARTAQQVSQLKLTSQQGTASVTTTNSIARAPASKVHVYKHPAPLPAPPNSQNSQPARKPIPPKPHLSVKRSGGGILLSWRMPYNLDNFESIVSYQLYAYQETTSPPSSEMWRKVGDMKALELPMACTLTQFAHSNKYHFAVRAVDVHKRMGPFSSPEPILL